MPIESIAVKTESILVDTATNTFTTSGSIATQGNANSIDGTITLTGTFVYPPGSPPQTVILGTATIVNGVIQPPAGTGSNTWTISGSIPPSSPLYNAPSGTDVSVGVQYSGSGTPTFNPAPPFPTDTVCFLAGTLIATPRGEVPIDTIRTGDLVLTADGRAVPVLWLGRQTVSTVFSMDENRRPVVIQAGALSQGLPRRDLRVTSGHALVFDGVLVNASALVNGTSIRYMSMADLGDTFTVFHIETTDHEIIVAEGAPTETFIDNVTRARFDNYAEFVALFGTEGRPMAELHQPRALSARQVPQAVRTMIAARASVLDGGTAAAA
jgi:hypothetical protein